MAYIDTAEMVAKDGLNKVMVNGVEIVEMFSGNNKVPWHSMGNVVAGLLTADEAIVAAHMAWGAVARPISVGGIELPLTDHQAIVRDDNNAVLGIVKGRYEIIQNREAFAFFDNIVAEGRASYETAGVLRNGKQIWIMAKYNGEIKINDDLTRCWCLLVTSHDGSEALSVQWVSERVVCQNTLSLALRGKKNSIKIRHTKNWANKEAEARRVLGLTENYFETMRAQLSVLQDYSMDKEQMSDFARLLFPATDESKVPTRTENMRTATAALFDRGAGNKGATRWDGLNAVSDWADHNSTIRGENSTRLESSLKGSAADVKQRAFDLLTAEDFTKQLIDSRPHVVSMASPALVATDDFARLLS